MPTPTTDPRLSVLDPIWYITTYPELQIASLKAILVRGRDGKTDTSFPLYVRAVGIAQNHWLNTGVDEGRQSSATFSIKDYIRRYPDLTSAFGTNYRAALNHWLSNGKNERRNSGPAKAKPGPVIVSGDHQTQARVPTSEGIDMAFFDPLVIKVIDLDGNPVVGAPVNWTINQGKMTVQAASDNGTSHSAGWNLVSTDAQGIARLQGGWPSKSMRAYYTDGQFTVTASCAGQTVTFSLTAGGTPVLVGKINIVSGDNQAAGRQSDGDVRDGVAYFAPLTVRLNKNDGTPAPNVDVCFIGESDNRGMAVEAYPTNVKSDANGIATAGQTIRAYYATGPCRVTANADGFARAVFHLTVL